MFIIPFKNLQAISTVAAQCECVMAAIFDDFPRLRKKRLTVLGILILIDFLCGLTMTFDSGFLMFTLMVDR